MHQTVVPTILGLGSKLPEGVRKNDDPIFAYLNQLEKFIEGNVTAFDKMTPEVEYDLLNSWGFLGGKGSSGKPPSPFYGYETRHVLTQEEHLIDIMKPAAEEALETADLVPEQIDMLLGCASVSKFIVPSDLYELHKQLALPASTLAVPLGNDFSNFNVALVLADSLIRTGRASNILIASGGNWSRAVDYHTLQAYSAGDGAAAAVLGPEAKQRWQTWRVIDEEVLAVSANFGSMYLAEVMHAERTNRLHRFTPEGRTPWQWPGMPVSELSSAPCFYITPKGFGEFGAFGALRAWEPAVKLL